MSAPKWAVGMRRVHEGIYVDSNGALHVDGAGFCEAHGYAPTRENVATVERALLEIAAETWPGIPVEKVVTDE
jgi:hypothetical protein